jgi:hypothetical protein
LGQPIGLHGQIENQNKEIVSHTFCEFEKRDTGTTRKKHENIFDKNPSSAPVIAVGVERERERKRDRGEGSGKWLTCTRWRTRWFLPKGRAAKLHHEGTKREREKMITDKNRPKKIN